MERTKTTNGKAVDVKRPKRWFGLLAAVKWWRSRNWKDIEYFDEAWKERIRRMASYVPAQSVVMDLGCGKQWLREYLDRCEYIPVDYCSRSADTLVCDINRGEFPDMSVDVCFVSGCLEYADKPDWLVGKIAAQARLCVISYCAADGVPDPITRASLGWKNSFTKDELVSLFESKGMRPEGNIDDFVPNNPIFKFVRQTHAETTVEKPLA